MTKPTAPISGEYLAQSEHPELNVPHPEQCKFNSRPTRGYVTLQERVRKFLDGKLDPNIDKTRLERILEVLVSSVDKGDKDRAQCAKILLERGWGMPQPSDAELNALTKGGIRILVLPAVPLQPEPIPAPSKPAGLLIGKKEEVE